MGICVRGWTVDWLKITSLKGSSEKAADFRIRLERAEKRLKEKEDELKAFEREKREFAFEMEKSVGSLRHELQRVRNKNRDLVALSDGLHKDKVSLVDAVKASPIRMRRSTLSPSFRMRR